MTKKPVDDQIDELTPYQQARLRMEMFFGGRATIEESIIGDYGTGLEMRAMTFVPALATYFREVLDNAMDEVIAKGYGTSIWVEYNPDALVFQVRDDGRGVPLDKVQTVFTNMNAGRNFRDREGTAGMNGVGATVVNYNSEFFEVTVRRDGKQHHQMFREDALAQESLIIEPAKVTKYSGSETGTTIRFRPSRISFPDLVLPMEFVRARVHECAATNPRTKFYFNGELIKVDRRISKTLFGSRKALEIPVDREVTTVMMVKDDEVGMKKIEKQTRFRSTFYLVYDFTPTRDDIGHSLVNNICAYNGGTHLSAFRSAFYNGLLEALEKESKRRRLRPNKSDIAASLLIYNITNMTAPNFDSQNKTRLTNKEAEKAVRDHLAELDMFPKIIRENKEWIDSIYRRAALRTGKQEDDEARRIQKQNSRIRDPKLKDANNRDRSKCILILGEGDSALNKAEDVVDRDIYALLPLRGKTMNVTQKTKLEVASNTVLAGIMSAIGLNLNERAIRSTLRYGKVYIATDEDEDGKNILGLLINFFYTYWPELFDPSMPPFFYRFNTPFVIVRKDDKSHRYFYSFDYSDFRPEDYRAGGYKITRAKGLGTLREDDWRHALENPRVTPMIADTDLKETLDLLFNENRADDRKRLLGI